MNDFHKRVLKHSILVQVGYLHLPGRAVPSLHGYIGVVIPPLCQTAGTWCVAHVNPVGAVVCIKVLAPVLVETTTSTAATHGDDIWAVDWRVLDEGWKDEEMGVPSRTRAHWEGCRNI